MISWFFKKNNKTCQGMITIVELVNTLRDMVSKVENQSIVVLGEISEIKLGFDLIKRKL